MSAFTYPGVYIEELPSGVHTITGVATSIAAFVGWAPQGPVSEATLVESWPEYVTIFGGFDYRSKLGYAVNQFFANGGQQAYIVRLVWDGSVSAAPGTNPVKAATAVAQGVGYPSTQITAATGSVVSSPPAMLYVGTAVLQSITITPGNLPPIPLNATGITFTATGTFSDSSQTNLSASAKWSSSNPLVISVAAGGAATPSGPGTATITATDAAGVISGSIAVTVTAATLSTTTGIKVTPSIPTLNSGQTQQFAATATYSDQTTHDVTALATWTPAGDFSTSPPTPGLFNQTAAGAYPIQAAFAGSTSPVTTVNVGAAAPVALIVTRVAATMTKGTTQVFNAEVVNSDGTITDVSGTASWASSNNAVAKFTAGNTLSALAVGSATITATSGAFSASTTVTVTAANLKSVAVTPAAPSIAKGQMLQLTATGVYDDGTTADLTGCADWASTDATHVSVTELNVTVVNGVATLSNGNVKGVAPGGPINITATFDAVPGTAAVSVTNPVIVSIAVTPKSKTVPTGQTWQFHATATLSDTTTQDITNTATWASSSPNVASISATGLATASATVGGSLTLFANNPGAWGNNLLVTVTTPSPNPKLQVQSAGARGRSEHGRDLDAGEFRQSLRYADRSAVRGHGHRQRLPIHHLAAAGDASTSAGAKWASLGNCGRGCFKRRG